MSKAFNIITKMFKPTKKRKEVCTCVGCRTREDPRYGYQPCLCKSLKDPKPPSEE